MRQSPIHSAARRIARTLAEMEIPFAIAGALAANAHGHMRTTEDVDILLHPQGLHDFKQAWLGRGWIKKFAGSKGFRDSQLHRFLSSSRFMVVSAVFRRKDEREIKRERSNS